ncbi:MAG: two-component system sensor histidine kinase NtrB [Candidatus Xenobia bacterium]
MSSQAGVDTERRSLRVLVIEDCEEDAVLLLRELKRGGYALSTQRVENAGELRTALSEKTWDIVIADYSLPQFDAPSALRVLSEMQVDLPFIIVSGTIGEETAVEAMRAGAHDFIVKGKLTRLIPAIERELRLAAERAARRQAEQALHESEQRFRSLIENALDIITVIDASGIFIYSSPSIERVLGYRPEDLHGRAIFGYVHQDDLKAMGDALDRAIDQPGSTQRAEFRFKHRDGTWRVLESIGKSLLEDPTVRGVVVNSRDITERKMAALALEESNLRLQEALSEVKGMSQQLWHAAKLATMGELTASIAHELNNPLATVSLRVETLLMGLPADDARRRPLEIVEQEVERMSGLVAHLLEFGRRGQRTLTTVDVREEIETALELVQYHLRKARVELVRDFASDLPGIDVDRQQLRQVLLNLLTNASDAMPEGGTLSLRVRGLDGTLYIEFTDTGTGISPENLSRIMEPFFSTKDPGKGTGLGLPICRRIVQEHYGTIDIESTLGEGTTVRVGFPVTRK